MTPHYTKLDKSTFKGNFDIKQMEVGFMNLKVIL